MTESNPDNLLYDVIDIKPYIRSIFNNWVLILVTASIATIGAFFLSGIRERSFEATALIVINSPEFELQFDPRFDIETADNSDLLAYGEIALSDEIMFALLQDFPTLNGSLLNLNQLRSMLDVDTSGSKSLIRLTAQANTSSDELSNLTNKWAQLVVDRANIALGNQNSDSVVFLEEQLEVATQNMEKIEEETIEFQSTSPLKFYQNELDDLNIRQVNALANSRKIDELLVDVSKFQEMIKTKEEDQEVSIADQVLLLSFQSKVLDLPLGNIQISLTGSESVEKPLDFTYKNMNDLLAELSEQLELERDESTQLREGYNKEILNLQGEIQALRLRSNQLTDNLNAAIETTRTFRRSLEEARISSSSVIQQASIAASSINVTESIQLSGLIIALLAGTLTTFLASIGVIAREWWLND